MYFEDNDRDDSVLFLGLNLPSDHHLSSSKNYAFAPNDGAFAEEHSNSLFFESLSGKSVFTDLEGGANSQRRMTYAQNHPKEEPFPLIRPK
jgi:hypothetical protein